MKRPAGRWRMEILAWALLPLLAVAAYLPALRVGFLSDDPILLVGADAGGLDLASFQPNSLAPFYRPVGLLLAWTLNYQLWGLDPFPYHLVGLLLYAAQALILGLWVAEVSSRPLLGW